MMSGIYIAKERVRRKIQRTWQKRVCTKSTDPLKDYAKSIVTVFYDVEGSYAIPGKHCADTVLRTLEVEAHCGIRSSYNVVAQLGVDEPEMIDRITSGGHEVASHSLSHRVLTTLSTNDIDSDIRSAKEVFGKLGTHIVGHRSPQSAWNSRVLNSLVKSGYKWSAEGGSEDYPYPIRSRNNHTLWRFPVRDDDWRYESHHIAPEEMINSLKKTVLDHVSIKKYCAIGFHPWVEASNDRFRAFEIFMHWLASLADVEIRPFGDVVRLIEDAAPERTG